MSKAASVIVDHRKAFMAELRSFGYKHNVWEVFRDFCELASLAMRLPFEKGLGERYAKTFGRYDKDEQLRLDRMSALVVDGLEQRYQDFLGSVFMEMEFGNNAKGQFFTPYHLCVAMAEMLLGNVQESIKERGFFTVMDPCVGGGAMLIAVAETLRRKGLNPSWHVYFIAQDVDLLACQMAHIQLSLCGMAGEIVWGNTLAVECKELWHTPVYYVNGWPLRLTLDKMRGERQVVKAEKPEPPQAPEPMELVFPEEPKPSAAKTEGVRQMEFSF